MDKKGAGIFEGSSDDTRRDGYIIFVFLHYIMIPPTANSDLGGAISNMIMSSILWTFFFEGDVAAIW